MHLLFENWHPKLEANFDHYLSLIKRPENIETMKKIKDTWLAPGFKERCLAAYPKLDTENTVICHCDAQENNVLLMRDCLTEIKLIDYEYTAFGPQEWDLANTFNEIIIDNNHPFYPFIRNYPENAMTIEEVKEMVSHYLGLKYENVILDKSQTKESYIEAHLD